MVEFLKKRKAEKEMKEAQIDREFAEEYQKLCEKYKRELVYQQSHTIKRIK